MATRIKPIGELTDDIITKFNLNISSDKLRAAIMKEIHTQLDPIVTEIDKFIASNPTHKKNMYKFLESYNPLCLYAYNGWQEKHYAFESAVMMVIQEQLNMDDKTFAPWFTKHITPLHNMIWTSFVSPLRERLWNLPQVPVKAATGGIMPVSNQIAVLTQIRTELSQLMLDIEQS